MIRCANAGFVVEKTLASGLADVFHNTSPLGNQAQPRIFYQQSLREAKAQGHLSSIMSDGISESRASSLAKGFESTAPAWLAQAQPCASSIIRANPAHPWFKQSFCPFPSVPIFNFTFNLPRLARAVSVVLPQKGLKFHRTIKEISKLSNPRFLSL